MSDSSSSIEKNKTFKNSQSISVSDINTSWIDRFSFLKQSDEQKEKIAKEILSDGNGDKLYWIEIILSTLIATFGLLQNSVAVIIGAMLIAPLIKPMQAMSFAMSSGQSRFFWRSSLFLAKSVLLSIGIATVFAFLIPIKSENSEILARITPNLLDLFIASFSAVIAFLAISYNRLSESVAGVAMAASLMPPLAVVGIELALGNFSAAWGGFLLFWVNFLAILIVGVVMFIFYGFTPHQDFQKKNALRKILTIIVILIFTCIPLYTSLKKISEKISSEKQITEFLQIEIPEKISGGKISEIKILDIRDEEIFLKGKIQVPENIKIFQSTYDAIIFDLEQKFQKKMEIDFQMIRTANLSSSDQKAIEETNITRGFNALLQENFAVFTPLQVSVHKNSKNIWEIQPIVSLPLGEYLEEEEKDDFLQKLHKNFPHYTFAIDWITVSAAPIKEKEKSDSSEEILQKNIDSHMKNFSQEFFEKYKKTIFIENIRVEKSDNSEFITLSVFILYPKKDISPYEMSSFSTTEVLRKDFFTLLTQNYEQNIELKNIIHEEFYKKISDLPYENIEADLHFLEYH